MALRHNTGGVSTIDTKMATSEVTNVRSNTTDLTNEAYKAVSAVGNYVRNVTDSLLEVLMDIAIGDVCDFNEMNYQFMQRLMYLNDNEIAITLKNVGSSAALYGDSTSFTSERQAPSYAQARNYIDNYAKTVTARENSGVDSTRKIGIGAYNGNVYNYVNHGQLYRTVENLFPDELDSGSGRYGGKWNTSSCMDSTLRKTKELFRMNKINTIISAFHTSPTTPESMGDARSVYGLSHGRNLLTKAAETKGGAYPINGYDNPYCRVWTHHYQYDRLDKLIRPFYVAEDSERKVTHVISLKKFHEWENFEGETGNEKWGWKSKSNDGWNYSVLGDNGFVNIAPKYLGGGAKNVHPKQCMFSIENLAWQGFSPYAFEKNLSWEQRGPLGGRIMWFPPYGLSFSEATTANWQPHTFIGRGEDVYTYTNTKRTGTLSFTLVVDHPSIVDYVTWSNNDTVSDTDLLRFFAGCEDDSKGQKTLKGESTTVTGDSGTLRDKVVPTPLTDEYLQIETFDDIEEEAEPQEVQPEEIPEYIAISFCVFYPNNYAGYYDQPGSDVEAIAYLLAGEGAQKDSTDTSAHPKDVKISFARLNESSGPGYEMLASTGDRGQKDSGITRPASDISQVGGNYIQGTSASWVDLTSYKDGGTSKRWYYRIDGEYSYPKTTEAKALNTYDQTLTLNKVKKRGVSQNYRD
ncbi:MAG: hypothetical protein LUD72_04435 [Bacteroidales bacterium]|nr:hypothetical protein [Bacteroidales bacterium]